MPDYDDVVERPLAHEVARAQANAYAERADAPERPALLSWGDLIAEAGASMDRIRRVAEYRHPAVERVGMRPLRQWLGPGVETVTLEGVMFPALRGGPADIEALRTAAAVGEARHLVDGRGAVLGRWAALRVEESWASLHVDGRPRRIEYALELAHVADDAPSGELRDLAAAADAEGDVAAVVDAVAAADTPAAAVAAATTAAGAAAEQAPERSLARRVLDAVRTAATAAASMPDVRRAALRAASRIPGAPRLDRPPARVAYRASAGDVLDAVAWRQYGRESAVADLLAADPATSRLPAVLPAAVLVGLPADPSPASAARRVVQLWT